MAKLICGWKTLSFKQTIYFRTSKQNWVIPSPLNSIRTSVAPSPTEKRRQELSHKYGEDFCSSLGVSSHVYVVKCVMYARVESESPPGNPSLDKNIASCVPPHTRVVWNVLSHLKTIIYVFFGRKCCSLLADFCEGACGPPPLVNPADFCWVSLMIPTLSCKDIYWCGNDLNQRVLSHHPWYRL